ncbi:unnamed protein product [Chondrus crispus]|uniref:Uncharacterized protein n=1 Tax=Chondrus crispus TaxID=2769 RepID=R7QD64_CHOCR|nr:unnamed protein product [Chondrus crispus]CDF35723.1 unnamed protein product [Chondrus crispus]|eukprot:XP_005715542.1 unnamed protein product [Chondrus crispus]
MKPGVQYGSLGISCASETKIESFFRVSQFAFQIMGNGIKQHSGGSLLRDENIRPPSSCADGLVRRHIELPQSV